MPGHSARQSCIAYFQRIALTTALGQESAELSRLSDGPSLIWNLLASATLPIWGGGRLRAQSDAQHARERIAELDYRDSVAATFADALTRLRYNGGEASRLQLIDAERAALGAQAHRADARRAVVAAQADLFRALGGGWSAVAPAGR